MASWAPLSPCCARRALRTRGVFYRGFLLTLCPLVFISLTALGSEATEDVLNILSTEIFPDEARLAEPSPHLGVLPRTEKFKTRIHWVVNKDPTVRAQALRQPSRVSSSPRSREAETLTPVMGLGIPSCTGDSFHSAPHSEPYGMTL